MSVCRVIYSCFSSHPLPVQQTIDPGATVEDIREFLSEAAFLKNFACHHIVRMLGVVTFEVCVWVNQS